MRTRGLGGLCRTPLCAALRRPDRILTASRVYALATNPAPPAPPGPCRSTARPSRTSSANLGRATSSKKCLLVAVAVTCITIALGVGLGVGLSKRDNSVSGAGGDSAAVTLSASLPTQCAELALGECFAYSSAPCGCCVLGNGCLQPANNEGQQGGSARHLERTQHPILAAPPPQAA